MPPSPNSNANPKPNPDPGRGAIFLGGNFPDTVFYTLSFFNCSTLFFVNLKHESMFLHNTVELLEMAFLFIKDLYKSWGFFI